MGIAVDLAGNVYFADSGSGMVRKVDSAGLITSIAGLSLLQLKSPHGLAIDKESNVYIAEADNHRISRIDKEGALKTISGTGVWGFSGDGAEANSARLMSPRGVAVSCRKCVCSRHL